MRKFQEYHPVVLLLYFVAVLFPVLFIMDRWLILLSILGGVGFVWLIRKRFPWKGLLLCLLAGFGFACMNGLLVHGGTTVLFFLNGKPVTLESIGQGCITGLMLGSAFLWFDCFSQVLGSEKILVLFRHTPKLALLLSMILKLVPSFMTRYGEVKMVAVTNGDGGTQDKKQEIAVVSAVLTWALERSMETADSMLYRNYKNAVKRGKTPWTTRDRMFLLVLIATQGIYISEGVARGLLAMILFGIPLLFEGKERLKWKFYVLRK